MGNRSIYVGNSKINSKPKEIIGELVLFENEDYYKISNYDSIPPFFMSIISHSNHWMFISSNGGLTAGRKNSESSLFPYYTDDKITESAHVTGSKTIYQVHTKNKTFLWEPFSDNYQGIYQINRNLYKNSYGNKIVFEEINKDLELIYRYQWNSSDKYGFIRKSTLINLSTTQTEITVLDGIQNIMPYGINPHLQNEYSNLADAYKKCELETKIGLGIYTLSAIIVDRAEPSEALKSTTVWSLGFDNPKYLISSQQLEAFRNGKRINQEIDIKAQKGAYFLYSELNLAAKDDKSWIIAADVNQSRIDIAQRFEEHKNKKELFNLVLNDIEQGTEQLIRLSGSADALQLTADKLRDTRHFANTLFNIMRGGIFDDNYSVEKYDFVKYIEAANKKIFLEQKSLLDNLTAQFSIQSLKKVAAKEADPDFKRLVFEYMPLKFSRRHGDPSRPWNKFSINIKADNGSKILDYQGNWRDIFQNWEALAHAYPDFIENMIHKFLNATTFDGYNPYRVTKDGFDWEAIEPDDPWSYIGYWGDHQIIYLLKFLEFIENYYPKKLATYFDENIFVYANVPYKIKSYSEILQNPKDTIVFDSELDAKIHLKRNQIGADGALLECSSHNIHRVNLIEKLLATILAKVSNLIPEGGIWMNTQRPEWNDANNALVGNGISMVTLYHLRRFLKFLENLMANTPNSSYAISEELKIFFDDIKSTLANYVDLLVRTISNEERKTILDGLANPASAYRNIIYAKSFSGKRKSILKADLIHFIELGLKYLNHSIDANKRNDNLYHAYNLMTLENDSEISISNLSEMLEGQVAVLSSGYLSSNESLKLLDALKCSKLFRDDQYSYILYPNKELPRFQNKNNIPSQIVKESKLMQLLLKDENSEIIERDAHGICHFNGTFNNANSLQEAINNLPVKYHSLAKTEISSMLEAFEEVFDHKSFTGRSGTFFGYEGLGSIYWHMVSKLLLSVQEICLKAISENESKELIGRLLEHYYEINEGIGVHKSPQLYGAFPTDPYSHTPGGKGAQQPGMTGQVKEDILSRFGELGVIVTNGKLKFKPSLLRREEFLKSPSTFSYINVENETRVLKVSAESVCYTFCQVPIIYQLSEKETLKVIFNKSAAITINDLDLDIETSKKIFERTGEIDQIIVTIKK